MCVILLILVIISQYCEQWTICTFQRGLKIQHHLRLLLCWWPGTPTGSRSAHLQEERPVLRFWGSDALKERGSVPSLAPRWSWCSELPYLSQSATKTESEENMLIFKLILHKEMQMLCSTLSGWRAGINFFVSHREGSNQKPVSIKICVGNMVKAEDSPYASIICLLIIYLPNILLSISVTRLWFCNHCLCCKWHMCMREGSRKKMLFI